VKINKPRIRPKKAKNIHGYLTEEAVTLEENLLPIDISEEGESPLVIYLPHPFSYLVMKLFALRDRLEDEEQDFGAYHAFDIYRIVGMITENEWNQAVELHGRYRDAPKIREAEEISGDLFASLESVQTRSANSYDFSPLNCKRTTLSSFWAAVTAWFYELNTFAGHKPRRDSRKFLKRVQRMTWIYF
jgi:hypothetical protein